MRRYDVIQEVNVAKRRNIGRSNIVIIVEVEKFNPYHDELGRFATAGGATLFTIRTKDPRKQHWADMAIAREKDGWEASKPKEIEFTPAKNKKEAVKYAQEKLGFQKVSYGTKMDLKTINHINETITNIQSKYPEVKGAVQELKTAAKKNVYARVRYHQDGKMNLEIGTNAYKFGIDAVETSYKYDVESGFHPKGTTANSIIWHEYGHVLAGISAKAKIGIEYSDTIGYDKRADFRIDRYNHLTEIDWLNKARVDSKNTDYDFLDKNYKDIAKNISKYAEKNIGELFAEAFAEVTCSPNPSKEAIALVKASGWYRE